LIFDFSFFSFVLVSQKIDLTCYFKRPLFSFLLVNIFWIILNLEKKDLDKLEKRIFVFKNPFLIWV